MRAVSHKPDSVVFNAPTKMKTTREKAVERGLVLVFALLCVLALSHINYII